MSADVLEEVSPAELLDLLGRETDGSDVTNEELEALLRSSASTSTKERVLRHVVRIRKKVAKVTGNAPGAEVLVRAAHRGRVTGYSMVCLGCGLVARRLAPSKRMAQLSAAGHIRTDHDGAGTIDTP